MWQQIGAYLDSLFMIGFGAFAVWVYPRMLAAKLERGEVGAEAGKSVKLARWSGGVALVFGLLGLLFKIIEF